MYLLELCLNRIFLRGGSERYDISGEYTFRTLIVTLLHRPQTLIYDCGWSNAMTLLLTLWSKWRHLPPLFALVAINLSNGDVMIALEAHATAHHAAVRCMSIHPSIVSCAGMAPHFTDRHCGKQVLPCFLGIAACRAQNRLTPCLNRRSIHLQRVTTLPHRHLAVPHPIRHSRQFHMLPLRMNLSIA